MEERADMKMKPRKRKKNSQFKMKSMSLMMKSTKKRSGKKLKCSSRG
jgi:hypothetical protein